MAKIKIRDPIVDAEGYVIVQGEPTNENINFFMGHIEEATEFNGIVEAEEWVEHARLRDDGLIVTVIL